ncbi:hypothetical protein [Aeromonas sp. s8]|uniref:hypothetical protein n=1 Tax=Aeromonas sp. s8 TaxID=3138489 RepID=UPI0034A349BA
MHRSCFSLLQMLLPMLLALSGSTVKAATQDQEWAQERANAVLSLMTFTVVPDTRWIFSMVDSSICTDWAAR